MTEMYGNTIKEECTVTGANTKPTIFHRKRQPIVTFSPNEMKGIRFSGNLGKTYVSFSPETLKAVNALSARFLRLLNTSPDDKTRKDKISISIVEHLISCLMALKITDIDIKTNTNRIPVRGPGLVEYAQDLEHLVIPNKRVLNSIHIHPDPANTFPQKTKLENDLVREIKDDGTISYSKEDGGLQREISIQKAESLVIQVNKGRHNDILNLEEKPITINFRDQETGFKDHLSARPVARVQKMGAYLGLKAFSKLTGSKAITSDNYIMVYPGSTKENIRKQMRPQYTNSHNEFLAHTAVCDFPAEIYAILHDLGGVTVDGKFSLSNTNHIFRIDVVNQIIKDRLFLKEEDAHAIELKKLIQEIGPEARKGCAQIRVKWMHNRTLPNETGTFNAEDIWTAAEILQIEDEIVEYIKSQNPDQKEKLTKIISLRFGKSIGNNIKHKAA